MRALEPIGEVQQAFLSYPESSPKASVARIAQFRTLLCGSDKGTKHHFRLIF